MKIVFNGYPEINQLLVNGYNRSFKDETFVVNNVERNVYERMGDGEIGEGGQYDFGKWRNYY